MIPNECIEVQTSPLDRPSVPAWFAEVAMIARHLASKGLLEAFAQERTLADFFERVAPFETAFMALFGRRSLPHRATLSRAPFRC
jgi:hypothetical protein